MNNESGIFGMSSKRRIELLSVMVKCSSLSLFGHLEKMSE